MRAALAEYREERVARWVDNPFVGADTFPEALALKLAMGATLDPEEQAIWDAFKGAVAKSHEHGESLGLVDLAEVMRGGYRVPEMLVPKLVVAAQHLVVFGAKESAKTWLVLAQAAVVMAAGRSVFWVDEEMGRVALASRLLALRVRADTVEEHFTYFEFPSLDGSDESQARWELLLQARRPALIVVDAQTEVLAAANLNENNGVDVAKWMNAYLSPARKLDAATVMIDHVGHDTSGRPVGSRHKGAAAKAELEVKCVKPFDAHTLGMIEVTRTKNTLAAPIPEVQCFELGGEPVEGDEARAAVAGPEGYRFVFREVPEKDSGTESDDPRVQAQFMETMRLQAEKGEELREKIRAALREAAKAENENWRRLSGNAVFERVGGRKADVIEALAEMGRSENEASVLAEAGPRNSWLYSWHEPISPDAKNCAVCGQAFTSKSPRAKYCSDACRQRARRGK